MKPKTSKPVRPAAKLTARAQRIASGILAGKTHEKIAREAGVSQKTVQRDLEQGPVQAVIIGLVAEHRDRISRQFARSLAVIDAACKADVLQLVKRTVIVPVMAPAEDKNGAPILDADGKPQLADTGRTIEAEVCEIHRIGPDHYARLAAVKRHLEIVTAGRQSVKPEEKNVDRTLLTIEALRKLAARKP